MKKVSVIIPCFNAAKWLPQCFLSLAQQTIGICNLELIFVNDASTDGGATWSLLMEMERAYPEDVLLIDLPENRRQGGARNEGLKYATGEYISFVDADDWVELDLYEKTYRRAKEENAEIVQFNHSLYKDSIGQKIVLSDMPDKVVHISTVSERRKWLLSEDITYGCWNKLYRTEIVRQAGVWYPEHVVYEEPLFVYPLYFYVSCIAIMKEPLYVYRQNESGTMYNNMKNKATLLEHANVQLAVWKFMKHTKFFHMYYEEIKLYFLHSYLYETLYFGKLRGFEITLDMFQMLADVVKSEVEDYDKSIYEKKIPKQMMLYKMIQAGNVLERDLKKFIDEMC